jgi:hypothetical protein
VNPDINTEGTLSVQMALNCWSGNRSKLVTIERVANVTEQMARDICEEMKAANPDLSLHGKWEIRRVEFF